MIGIEPLKINQATVKIGLKATPNVLRFRKVLPSHHVFGFLNLVNDQDNKKMKM